MPQAEVYEALSDPLRRPDWIRDLKRVMPGVRGVDHWVMHGPVGAMMWDVEQTIHRAPHSLAWCMSADEGSGFMRFDLAQFGGRTRITASRQFWFRPWAKPFQQWWGDPGLRLQGDVSHLVEMLRSGPGPQVNAVGFRPTAARTSRDP